VKYALSLRGEMSPEVRLPLCEMTEASKRKLEATLRNLQLIS
jgi:4-hydroxy-tetrahydrodipicolinate synthase